MKKKIILSLWAACALFVSTAYAQLQMPMPSPSASVSQQVGFNKISIDYSSPGLKGREIFGDLLPYGTTWRAGANAPTTITFSAPVKIGNENVGAGSYSLFITPQQQGPWVLHINNKTNSVYNYMQDGKVDEDALAADDLVSLEITPENLSKPQERLIYYISAQDNNIATVTMEWADVRLSFPVDTQSDEMLDRIQQVIK